MTGLTLEQLQKMGATPIAPATTTPQKKGKGFTLAELQKMEAQQKTLQNPNSPAILKVANPQFSNEPTFEYTGDEGIVGGVAKTVGNVPKSLFNLGKGVVSAVANPIDTVKNVANVVKGVGAAAGEAALEKTEWGQKFLEQANESRKQRGLPELKRDEQGNLQAEDTDELLMAKGMGQYFKERYGGAENIKRTLVEDPAGLALDASMFLSGGSTATAEAAKIAEVSGALKTAKALNTGSKLLTQSSKMIDPISQTTKVIKPVVNKAVGTGKNIITKTGEELQSEAIAKGVENMGQKGVKSTLEKTSFTITDEAGKSKKITPIDTFREYKFTPEVRDGKVNVDKIKQSVKENMRALDSKIDETISANNVLVDVNAYQKMLEDAINATNKSVEAKSLLKDKLATYMERVKKDYPDGISIEEVNKIRKEANKDYNPDTIDFSRVKGNAGREIVYNTTDDQAVKAYLLEQRKLLNAEDFALRLEGNAVKGGRLDNMFFTATGAMLGQNLGPVIGPLVGATGGRVLSEILQRRQFRSLPGDIKVGAKKLFDKSNKLQK